MALQPSTRLGPYEIISSIGAGGMGEVYRARDTRLDRIVAIKVLPTHLSSNPQSRERFDREAKAISSLSHPHICPLYDVGHQDGVDFLVMEYPEGETLANRLRKGPLPPDQVLQYATQITDALDTAHRHGVVHRDLKPGNVMLVKSGAKIVDFGLAKVRTAEAVAGMTALPTETELMVLNEPETSLHPDLLPALARLILVAAKNMQIIVVSHAPQLIEQLTTAPVCTRLHLLKEFGETKLEGSTLFNTPKWDWPAR